jgi:hypothetical protein
MLAAAVSAHREMVPHSLCRLGVAERKIAVDVSL